MKIKHLSPSSINTFDMCNYAYYLNYEKKMRGFQNKGAALGTITHAALEEIADRVVNGKEYDIEKILKPYYKKETAKYDYIDFEKSDYEDCINWIKKVLFSKKYRCIDNNESCKILGIEKKFDFIISKNGELINEGFMEGFDGTRDEEYEYIDNLVGKDCFRVLGFIDLIVDRGDGCLEIIDYKTSKTAKSYDKLKKDVQLSVYNLVSKFLYPEYDTRIVTIYYLRKKPITVYLDDDTKDTARFLYNKWKEIKRCEKPLRTITVPDLYWKCRFCSFYDNSAKDGDKGACKRQCDIFYKLEKGGFDMTRIAELINEGGDLEKILLTKGFEAERCYIYGI